MLSRRVFLLSAFAVPGLSILPRVGISSSLFTGKVLVLSEDNCADTTAFAACLPARSMDTDPGPVLQELDKSFRLGEYDLVFGLTRDSNFVLVEQYAQASAYQLCYHGTHQYTKHVLSHSLTGKQEIIRHLTSQIAGSSGDWVKALSQVPLLANIQSQNMLSENLVSQDKWPDQSPGLLVSWMFQRGYA